MKKFFPLFIVIFTISFKSTAQDSTKKTTDFFLWLDSKFDFTAEEAKGLIRNEGTPAFYLWGSVSKGKWGASFTVYHDVSGLAEIYGGPLFNTSRPKKHTYHEANLSAGISASKTNSGRETLFMTAAYGYVESKQNDKVASGKVISVV